MDRTLTAAEAVRYCRWIARRYIRAEDVEDAAQMGLLRALTNRGPGPWSARYLERSVRSSAGSIRRRAVPVSLAVLSDLEHPTAGLFEPIDRPALDAALRAALPARIADALIERLVEADYQAERLVWVGGEL